MHPTRRAVVDVGTNSVKLLVAEVDGREIRPVCEQSHQTRLGQGFYETHRLRAEAIQATAEAVAAFADIARAEQATSIRVIATSAAREALNRDELTSAIERASGLKVDVISGEQEAELGFQGVTTDAQLAQRPLLLMDVGGGSAQFVFGCDGRLQFRQSFPLGAVRLLETLPCSDPPKPSELAACRQWLKEFLQREVWPKVGREIGGGRHEEPGDQSLLTSILRSTATTDGSAPTVAGGELQLVGVGGTATILGCMEAELAAFDRARIEATHLSAARVSWHLERLWGMPLEQRKRIVGLPSNRADVILMGAAIYQAVMQFFGFPELRISTRGLRFAALLG
jgi:exopolyphosphatase / guanosine-5'-triphosphate,3'-diphosphate pyrophosphatase